jgi:hypothetical protein
MQNEKISFKPLHDGMGFHPFSEGLPYAPTAPTVTPNHQRGTGALSAGTPSFSTPKTTRQIQQQNVQSTIAEKPVIQATSPALTQSILRKRFFAYLLDTVVHLGFWIAINLIAIFAFQFELDGALLEKNWLGFTLFFIFSQWFFIAMQEMLFENSIGKLFFGLEFKRNRHSFFASSLLLRSIVFMIGALSAGLGLYFLPQDKIAELQLKHS